MTHSRDACTSRPSRSSRRTGSKGPRRCGRSLGTRAHASLRRTSSTGSGAPCCRRAPGYVPPEIDYVLNDDSACTITVRDSDVRYLDRVPPRKRRRAREPDPPGPARRPCRRLRTRSPDQGVVADDLGALRGADAGRGRVRDPLHVERRVHRGAGQSQGLHPARSLEAGFRHRRLQPAVGRRVPAWPAGDAGALASATRSTTSRSSAAAGWATPSNPLLIAMRSAVSEYIPGFMPTYLNVGLTPERPAGTAGPLRRGRARPASG